MSKNYVDDKEMELLRRKDETEKGRTGYYDGEDPQVKQEFPGEEIVEDLRELSRQQGPRDEVPTYLSGENVEQENNRQRYGDSISKNASKEFHDPPTQSQNKSKD